MAETTIKKLSLDECIDLQRFITGALGESMYQAQGLKDGVQALAVLDTRVSLKPADFKTEWVCYVVDVGGSFIRAHRVSLLGSKSDVSEHIIQIGGDEENAGLRGPNTPASTLWDCVASCVHALAIQHKECLTDVLQLACVIGFPLEQTQCNQAKIAWLSKGFETGKNTNDALQGCDVNTSVVAALKRQGISAEVNVICNDSVAAIAAGDFFSGTVTDCMAAAIVGTGVNLCYREPISAEVGFVGNVINTEVGQMTANLPVTNIDKNLAKLEDRELPTLELMSGGKYLGELCRLSVIQEMAKAPANAQNRNSITSEECSAVWAGSVDEGRKTLTNAWAWEGVTDEEVTQVQEIFSNVFTRGAQLISAAISAAVNRSSFGHTREKTASVCLTGSVLVECEKFQNEVRSTVRQLTPHKKLQFKPLSDAGAVGAARLASPVIEE